MIFVAVALVNKALVPVTVVPVMFVAVAFVNNALVPVTVVPVMFVAVALVNKALVPVTVVPVMLVAVAFVNKADVPVTVVPVIVVKAAPEPVMVMVEMSPLLVIPLSTCNVSLIVPDPSRTKSPDTFKFPVTVKSPPMV